MVAELDGDAAQNQQPQHHHQRQIEAAETGRIERREGEVEGATGGQQPDFVAVPNRSDCAEHHAPLVIGAGDCLDVPVAELVGQFAEVLLADVVVSPAARRLARRFRGRLRSIVWDATGALPRLAAGRRTITLTEARLIFEQAEPGSPPGGEPDLVVSANCLSQLGLVPGHSLSAAETDDKLPDACAAAAARRHLEWLAKRSGVRVVLADCARLDIAPDGRVLKREDLRGRFGLRVPDRAWRWELAPIPEWSPDFHRVHEVGAWIDGPR